MVSPRHSGTLLAIFIIASIALRFFLITADPPASISFGGALFTDEGYKTDYPRVLFFGKADQLFLGDFCDGCSMPFVYNFNNPLINSAYIASFSAFGPGFFSIRLVAILLSIGSIALFFFLLKAIFGARAALLSTALLSINFVFFMYNRLAFFENFSLLFIIASFFAMHYAFSKGAKAYALLSLALFSLAVFCKTISIAAFPAIAFLFLSFAGKKIAAGSRLKFVAVSALFFVFVNIFLGFFNYNLGLHETVIFSAVPDGIFMLARDLLIAPVNQAFVLAPLFSLIGFASALLFAYISLNEQNSEKRLFKQAFAIFLFFGFFAFGFFLYQPPRYFYILIPSLAVFAGLFFDRAFSRSPLVAGKGCGTIACKAMLLFSAFFIAYALAANAVKIFVGTENFIAAIIAYIVLFAIVFACFFAFIRAFSGKRTAGSSAKNSLFFIGCALFASIIVLQLLQYASWAWHPQYSLLDSSREFGALAEQLENPVAAGQWCPVLAIETDVLCHRGGFGGPIKEELFGKLGINILVADEGEWAEYGGAYNSYKSQKFDLIKDFDLGGTKVSMFRVSQVHGN